jgi:hypothetical protein
MSQSFVDLARVFPLFASETHFANVWQNRAFFAKHWQIHPPRSFQFLPSIGKMPGISRTGFTGWTGWGAEAVQPEIKRFQDVWAEPSWRRTP